MDEELEEDRPSLIQSQTGGVRRGVAHDLEYEADRILAKGREGITKHSMKKDYLSTSQLFRRKSREVFPTSGVPEKHIVQGLFKRRYAPSRKKGPSGTQ